MVESSEVQGEGNGFMSLQTTMKFKERARGEVEENSDATFSLAWVPSPRALCFYSWEKRVLSPFLSNLQVPAFIGCKENV